MPRPRAYRPEALLAVTFAALILCGSGLLMLPAAHKGPPMRYLDALFTATSAVCVTGLTTVDTATAWTRFGQTVILVLIQGGGLGIMTFAALAAQVLGRRLSFSSDAAWKGALLQEQARGNIRAALRNILALTVLIELLGTLLLFAGLRSYPQPKGGWYEALFLSISAFCNAGFSVYSDNAMGLQNSALILFTLMALIVLGGIGYPVLLETVRRTGGRLFGRPAPSVRWSLHARVVLWVSGGLILGGAALLALLGVNAPAGGLSGRLIHSLFQSVSARTAGFNTVDLGQVPVPALLILTALMFIGGSPGSCAGGIKTTTSTVWVARVWARAAGRDDVNLWGRRIPQETVRRAALVVALSTLWNVAGVLLLAFTEHVGPVERLEHVVFEQVSAFGTVGLSTGLTPVLSPVGKLWIIATMFVGRVGPLALAMIVLTRPPAPYHYATERVMIG